MLIVGGVQAREVDKLMATSQLVLAVKLERGSLRQQLGSFTAWWTSELQALMPLAWRERLRRGTRRLLVDVDGSQARVSLHNADGVRELATLNIDADMRNQPEVETVLHAAARESFDEIIVRVAQRHVITSYSIHYTKLYETVPTMHGESVVMRLLNKESITLEFATLGFADDTLKEFLEVLTLPYGMILVTGPTGSGKTTTLYTVLNRLNTTERKIITVEDPVEYELEGINQIQVNPAIELTFANSLRSIVRQDPDVIMVGEMRDLETARICVQSALTGHLVLSTLHTNDAPSSVARLVEMGVEDYLLTSTVNAVIAQRLVRVLVITSYSIHYTKLYDGVLPTPFLKQLGINVETKHGTA